MKYDVTVYTKMLTKEQVKHAVNLFLGLDVPDDDIVSLSQSYEVKIAVTGSINMRATAMSIASYVQTFDQKAFVRVRDTRFIETGHGIRWTNDGITAYSDSSVYEDPMYEFHYNDFNDYQIVYIPIYANRFCPRDKERYEKSGAKYMWRCTACWDNFMQAQTIEDAIEEFEEMYFKKLWSSVTNVQKELERATDRFREFYDYRSRK